MTVTDERTGRNRARESDTPQFETERVSPPARFEVTAALAEAGR